MQSTIDALHKLMRGNQVNDSQAMEIQEFSLRLQGMRRVNEREMAIEAFVPQTANLNDQDTDTYAVGKADGQGGMDMFYGPTPNLSGMLACPPLKGYIIVRFFGRDCDEEIYREVNGEWRLIGEPRTFNEGPEPEANKSSGGRDPFVYDDIPF